MAHVHAAHVTFTVRAFPLDFFPPIGEERFLLFLPSSSFRGTNRFVSFSFVADSQDVDLDAILGELCALERRCDGDIAATSAPDAQRQGRPNSTRITPGDNTDIGKNEGGTCPEVLNSSTLCVARNHEEL